MWVTPPCPGSYPDYGHRFDIMLHIQANCAAKEIISVHCRRPVKQSSLCFYYHASPFPLSPFMLNLLQHPFIVSLQGRSCVPVAFFFCLAAAGPAALRWPEAVRGVSDTVVLKVKTALPNYCQNIKHAFLKEESGQSVCVCGALTCCVLLSKAFVWRLPLCFTHAATVRGTSLFTAATKRGTCGRDWQSRFTARTLACSTGCVCFPSPLE